MRVWVVLAFLLAGCIQGGQGPDDDAGAAALPIALQVVRFDASGVVATEGPGVIAVRALDVPGAEPSIERTEAGTFIVAASDFPSGQDLVMRSTDDGESWQQAFDYRDTGHISLDPTTWYDHLGRLYVNHLRGGTCSNTLWSDDDGVTWELLEDQCAAGLVDHQKLAVGPAGPMDRLSAERITYLCYNAALGPASACAVSRDGGPFTVRPLFAYPACGGMVGRPAIAADGTIVVPATHSCRSFTVAVSTDSGNTWMPRPGPLELGASDGTDPAVGLAADGTLYALFRAADQLPYLARSTDLGQSWDVWRAAPPDVGTAVFTTLTVGEGGRLGLAFLATEAAEEPSYVPDDAVWHLWLVAVEGADEEPTFTAYQATPDPVQVGPVCMGFGDGTRSCDPEARNLLEFIGSTMTTDGRFTVVFADGCTGDCTSALTSASSRDRATTIARLDGWTLLP